jgi:hypothetical protein
MGKGSGRRPQLVPDKDVQLRWEYAFRKDNRKISFEEWKEERKHAKRNPKI